MSRNWPQYSPREIERATAVLASGRVNYWTGTEGRDFEAEFARFCQTRFGVALANGTVSLELALRVLGVGPGDEVIVSPRSFLASVSCVCMVGATPVFADVDPRSQNIEASTIAPCITSRTKAIIPVHLAGWPADMVALEELAVRHRIAVVEDCAQAHGATVDGRSVGSFGAFGSFSFCQDKIMSTGGEGGMLVTDEEQYFERARSLKDHGKNFAKIARHKGGTTFQYVHDDIGTNYRMTEVQAAIGRVQLELMPGWLERRRANAALRSELATGIPAIECFVPPSRLRHAYYKFYLFIKSDQLKPGWSRDRVVAELVERGVRCFSGSCPEIYREQALVSRGFSTQRALPVARSLGERSLLFLVDPTVSAQVIEEESEHLNDVMTLATSTQVTA